MSINQLPELADAALGETFSKTHPSLAESAGAEPPTPGTPEEARGDVSTNDFGTTPATGVEEVIGSVLLSGTTNPADVVRALRDAGYTIVRVDGEPSSGLMTEEESIDNVRRDAIDKAFNNKGE